MAKIAFDLDEVIADFMDALLQFYYKKKGKLHSKEEFLEYKWWPVWGMEKDEAVKLVDEFHDTHKLDDVKLAEGALESITRMLNDKHELFVITARPVRFKEKVESWIRHHLKTDNIKVIHSGDFHKSQAASKAEICNELGIKLLLEDSGETALDCAKKGIQVILFDKPWNQTVKNPDIHRVHNWSQAIVELSALIKI